MYNSEQTLNEWIVMLETMYGGSQNYAKTPYELHAHLTEVCGIFAKQLFKKRDTQTAIEFLPKIFAWSAALFEKLSRKSASLEDVILKKFPDCCTYCLNKPCVCWKGEKPSYSENDLRNLYYQNAPSRGRSVNDFQLMFRQIYEKSWSGPEEEKWTREDILRRIFIRLIEEVAEVGESIRFHHLYPENFNNEIADVIAWWFALVSMVPSPDDPKETLLAEKCLWDAYPGRCQQCLMLRCLCRPGPVRQLMSRPIAGFDHRFDSLTSVLNRNAYNEDIEQIIAGNMSLLLPGVCVRIDVDKFKAINDKFGHPAGDEALQRIATILRQTVREHDHVYRVGGDEFGILFGSFTEEEAFGLMRRVRAALSAKPVRWVNREGKVFEFAVTVSIGVAEVNVANKIEDIFNAADAAALISKKKGLGYISKASDMIINP